MLVVWCFSWWHQDKLLFTERCKTGLFNLSLQSPFRKYFSSLKYLNYSKIFVHHWYWGNSWNLTNRHIQSVFKVESQKKLIYQTSHLYSYKSCLIREFRYNKLLLPFYKRCSKVFPFVWLLAVPTTPYKSRK